MSRSTSTCLRLVLVAAALALATPASAIPAFARKYGTSCLTCHTVYPKLTPFGEAFRRNGYMFPGVDSDYVKADQVQLGQEANKKTFPNSVWPASIPSAVPLSVGANGQADHHPVQDLERRRGGQRRPGEHAGPGGRGARLGRRGAGRQRHGLVRGSPSPTAAPTSSTPSSSSTTCSAPSTPST